MQGSKSRLKRIKGRYAITPATIAAVITSGVVALTFVGKYGGRHGGHWNRRDAATIASVTSLAALIISRIWQDWTCWHNGNVTVHVRRLKTRRERGGRCSVRFIAATHNIGLRATHKSRRPKSAGDSEKVTGGKRKKKASAKAAAASDGRKKSSSKAISSASTAGAKKQKVHQGGSLPSAMQKRLEALMTALMNKENAVLFATAVDPDEYPDYYQLIPEPMDFGKILEKVQVCSHK